MPQGRANGGVDAERGGADAAAGRMGPRPQRPARSHPSSSGSAASSSSGEGGGKKQGRRKSKRTEAVVRAIRDRLPAPPACWGNVSVVQERRHRRERPGDHGRGYEAVEFAAEEGRSGAGTAGAAPAWCCLCPEGDCSLEPNPSANGKEDPGLRSLIERNDFYSDDCNPHATAAAVTDDDDDEVLCWLAESHKGLSYHLGTFVLLRAPRVWLDSEGSGATAAKGETRSPTMGTKLLRPRKHRYQTGVKIANWIAISPDHTISSGR